MSTFHLHQTTTATPEQFIAGLTDFGRVVPTTTDSNVWGDASGHTYTFARRPNGTTDVAVTVVRDGKNRKGRVVELVLKTVGRNVLEKTFENTVRAIEARNGSGRQ